MITCRIEKPDYEELISFMRYQIDDAFPHLRGEQRMKSFTDKLYTHADFCFCRDEGRLVGMIAYYANGEGADFVYLTQVYVLPDYRRKGIFTRMLDIVTQDTKCKGFHEIRLEVYKNRAEVQRCYMHNGFLAMHVAKPDTLFMNKEI